MHGYSNPNNGFIASSKPIVGEAWFCVDYLIRQNVSWRKRLISFPDSLPSEKRVGISFYFNLGSGFPPPPTIKVLYSLELSSRANTPEFPSFGIFASCLHRKFACCVFSELNSFFLQAIFEKNDPKHSSSITFQSNTI